MIYLELKFSEEELAQIEALSGAGYSPEKIAMYLDVDKKKFLKEWKNENTIVRYHYDRGLLLDSAAIAMKLAEHAKGGNITAIQQLDKIQRTQRVENLKKKYLYGEEIDGL